jgi:hypothetical protein
MVWSEVAREAAAKVLNQRRYRSPARDVLLLRKLVEPLALASPLNLIYISLE